MSRTLEIDTLLAERSLFLLGPRQTGKSAYFAQQIEYSKSYNLLDRGLFLRLNHDQTLMRQEIEAEDLRDCVIVIDEIQKLPELLDEVHLLIEQRGIRFLLTGSSARKLKRENVNLLGGRVRTRFFHPFVSCELDQFDLNRALYHGLIPFHYLNESPDEDLEAYTGRYLQEEISAEGISRNLPGFSRFLHIAAKMNGELLNFSEVGNDAQVSRQTVQNWYEVLKDTLIGFEVPSYTHTNIRNAITTSKFYLFDPGVVRYLRGLSRPSPKSKDFGDLFETFIACELKAWLDYNAPRKTLKYWRSKSQYEVDFILDDCIAIEVKSSENIQNKHLKGLRALMEENKMQRYICLSHEKTARSVEGIDILPWGVFLKQLWDGELLAV